jgi:hypothetical protein
LAIINVLHDLFTKEGVFFEHNAYVFVPLSYVCCRVKLDGVGIVQLQGVVAGAGYPDPNDFDPNNFVGATPAWVLVRTQKKVCGGAQQSTWFMGGKLVRFVMLGD